MNVCIFGDSIVWGASDKKGGLHPDSNGHQKIFEVVKKELF